MAADKVILPLDTGNTGKNIQTFLNTISALAVEATAVVAVNSAGVEITTANAIGMSVTGDVNAAATDGGAPVKMGLVFNTTPPTVTTGQRANAQCDAQGRLLTSQATVKTSAVIALGGNGSTGISCVGYRSAAVVFTGTWVATVAAQVSADGAAYNNTQFYNTATQIYATTLASNVLGNGTWVIVGSGGMQNVQITVTGWSSGTVAGTIAASTMDVADHATTGNVASGIADTGNPVKTGGVFNTTVPVLTTGMRGDTQMDAGGRTVVGSDIASAAADAGNPIKVGGVLKTTPIALTNAQRGDLQMDATGGVFVNTEGRTATYRLCVQGYAPYAAATDIFVMSGSASKTVRVKRVSITGTATGAVTNDVQVVLRTAANTGGTTASVLANAMTLDSTNAATTVATAVTYSVVPTTLGAGGNAEISKYTSVAPTAIPQDKTFEFGTRANQPLVLRGSSQFLAINLNAGTVGAGGSWDIVCDYEESSW